MYKFTFLINLEAFNKYLKLTDNVLGLKSNLCRKDNQQKEHNKYKSQTVKGSGCDTD